MSLAYHLLSICLSVYHTLSICLSITLHLPFCPSQFVWLSVCHTFSSLPATAFLWHLRSLLLLHCLTVHLSVKQLSVRNTFWSQPAMAGDTCLHWKTSFFLKSDRESQTSVTCEVQLLLNIKSCLRTKCWKFDRQGIWGVHQSYYSSTSAQLVKKRMWP